MRVDDLARGRHQPFYHVLVDARDREGNQVTYVAEDNISSMLYKNLWPTGDSLQHAMVNDVFVGFDSTKGRFVPSPRFAKPTEYQPDIK